MDQKSIRVFVGDLPPDTVEEDVKTLMEKYASVLSVEIKHRVNGPFAFVNLKDLKADLNRCFQELSSKKWKGHNLRVQLAKESFLERLAQERLENKKSSIKNVNVFTDTLHNINGYDNRRELPGHNVAKSQNRSSHDKNSNNKHLSTDSEDSNSSDSDIPKESKLCMFHGTKAYFEDEETKPIRKNSKVNSSKISTNKIYEEKEILGKFEMFNSVWKDDLTDVSRENTSRNCKIRKSFLNENASIENVKEKQCNNEEKPTKKLQETSKIKHEASEQRRKKAMEDRQKEILKRKQAVKFALASVDCMTNTSRPNKKILFTEDDSHGENSYQNVEQKLTLFSDDEMEYEINNENDFRIRKHYEGEKGQSLLALQGRYGNDKRFILDERFVESDPNEQEGEKENEKDISEVERQKLCGILGDVLGKDISGTSKPKPKNTKLMLRYDPTKPDHEKFEIKQDTQKSKKTKKDQNDNVEKSATVDPITKPEETLPIVSKERYYQVSETLKETLENKNEKFSLLEMFGDENEDQKDDVNFDTKPLSKKREWLLNPFKDDCDALENENYEQNMTADQNNDHNFGVKHESLFFDKNDPRFIEGIEYINHVNEHYLENFDNIRKKRNHLVKKKVRLYKKKAQSWRTKLGGRKLGGRKITPLAKFKNTQKE